MSFIYLDRDDSDYVIVRRSSFSRRCFPRSDISVYDRLKEEERIEKENNNLENFYAGGL